MPIKYAIWKVAQSPEPLKEIALATEQQLEDMIVARPGILSDDWMLIGRQEITELGGRIDLPAIAPDASLVLIELKRDQTPRDVIPAMNPCTSFSRLCADAAGRMSTCRIPNVLVLLSTLLALGLAGCATHEPLPQLRYKAAPPVGGSTPVSTAVKLEAGEAIGHALTSYALLPGGYAMPIRSPAMSVTDFNAEDQAALVQNLARVLTDRGFIRLSDDANAAAEITVKFLKTEHFPDMQDYVLDVLVAANVSGTAHDKIYHMSTIEGVNLGARMFQHAIDGRRHAGELFLTAAVPDLENWLTNGAGSPPPGSALVAPQPFNVVAPKIEAFLRERYARPSTFWKDGISVFLTRPSERVAAIELRWSDSDALPPFCFVDLYADGGRTKIVIREKNPLIAAKAHVLEAVQEYLKGAP